MSYVLRYCFGICVSVRRYDISTPLQNSTVLPDFYRMEWHDCNRMDWREHIIGPFLHDLMIGFKLHIFHIQIRSTSLPIVMWWVMFCEIIPHVLASWFPINDIFFFFTLSFIQ